MPPSVAWVRRLVHPPPPNLPPGMRLAPALLLGVASMPLQAAGHGAMVHPRSRNSIDDAGARFHGGSRHTFGPCANISGGACSNGQAAFWYSQGCFIGCPECDHVSGRRNTDLCKKGFVGQLPSHAIAVNGFHPNDTAVERNSIYDIYRHNPWRAPGHAPVADPCGLAGGTPWATASPEEGEYLTTNYTHHGMKGTDLPPVPTGVQWKIGGTAEVSWNVLYSEFPLPLPAGGREGGREGGRKRSEGGIGGVGCVRTCRPLTCTLCAHVCSFRQITGVVTPTAW
eukprot:SAG25_NODE_103_length_15482_cov_9.187415_6_plen_283_part_00